MAETTTAPTPDEMPEWKRRVLFGYIAIGVAFFTWKLIEFFPSAPAAAADKVSLLNITFQGESRLILIALLAGVVGGFVHIAVSYAQYRATKTLTEEWFAWYLLRPVIGGGLAMAFYAVIRAGFVAPGAGADTSGGASQILSPYGILAIGLLVGLCNAQAERKLRSVGQALFDSSRGKDDYRENKSTTTELATPIVSATEPQKLAPAVAGKQIKLTGSGFDASRASVMIDSKPLKIVKATSTELLCEFASDADPLSRGEHKLEVVNKNGEVVKKAEPFNIVVAP